MAAALLGERGVMRALVLAVLAIAPATAARADPAQEARSATAACLSAVIDGAPVEDIDGDFVVIRRGKDPVSCTVRADVGEPVVIRDAMLTAITARHEMFRPAKTQWAPGDDASRETFCNLPGRRAIAVVVHTAKPGHAPVAAATVFETSQRDERCDRDLGLQTAEAAPPPAAAEPAPEAAKTAAAAPPPDEIAPPPPKPKKKGWLSRIPNPFDHKD
jgi:hypothetical protein